ncbi:unnamed protein product [Candidula unifasciata]|uniref:Spaetzle domain-containing protein n=1 Tax=Candidula unifasciata TaxID=100452 RepID=A0A8S3ZBX0_9EUPU|nr:unnamed protein product [Candidula unifasciata]
MMSNIPLLYCLLYYRTGRQLKPVDRAANFQTHLEGDSLFLQDSARNQTFSSSTLDPPWMYHSRRPDLNRLCYNINPQTIEGTHGHVYNPDVCYAKTFSDIGKIFPHGFTSEHELHKIILRLNWAGTTQTACQQQTNCGQVCSEEIGYEVTTEVTDFNGQNHTVINLQNAYQFIPSGKCLNENTFCSGGQARCKQVYRAHWTLVWSSVAGVQLVAHEVPSHCECINFGTSSQTSSFANAGHSAGAEGAGV